MERSSMKCHQQGVFLLFAGLALVSGLRGEQKEEPAAPSITYEMFPPILPVEKVNAKAASATNAAVMSASEAYAADSEAKASEALEAATAAKLVSTQQQLESKLATQRAAHAVEKTRQNRIAADEAAINSRLLIEQIPIVAHRGAVKAVKEVVAVAVEKMNVEANVTAMAALAAEKKAFEAAALRAQQEALPFQQTKLRAQQESVTYNTKARELAQAAQPLKNEAVRMAGAADTYQKVGNVVVAQKYMMQAHDLLDKALQYEGTAKGFFKMGNQIQGEVGNYELGAVAAAEWGAYQANPAGKHPGFPPLPRPLKLKAVKAAPAPAPAAAPAAA